MLAKTKRFRHAEELGRGGEGYRSWKVRVKTSSIIVGGLEVDGGAEKLDVHGNVREGGDCAINGKRLDLRLSPTKILSVSYGLHIEIH